jgi:hypothetical protein
MSSDEEGEGKETALSTAASLLKVSRLSTFILDPEFFPYRIQQQRKGGGKSF